MQNKFMATKLSALIMDFEVLICCMLFGGFEGFLLLFVLFCFVN